MIDSMKTLSVRQPYATLICAGIKDVENRSWSTEYRGTVLIHASQWSMKPDLFIIWKELPLPLFKDYEAIASNLDDTDSSPADLTQIIRAENGKVVLLDENYRLQYQLLKTELAKQLDEETTLFLTQAIVGSVDIVDVVRDSKSEWSERGQYHWILKNPVLYAEPLVSVKGKLRLWNSNREPDTTPIDYVRE